MPKGKKHTYRKRHHWQIRLVEEFIGRYLPGHPYQIRKRVGPFPRWVRESALDEGGAMLVGSFRRCVDAVVFLPDRNLLIEGRLRADFGAVGELETYEELLPQTPELAELNQKPIEKVLVCVKDDPVVSAMAREQQIRVVLFRPKWALRHLAKTRT